jgi:hypothetical protein
MSILILKRQVRCAPTDIEVERQFPVAVCTRRCVENHFNLISGFTI